MTPTRYAPDFNLTINDNPIPAALRATVTGIRYQDGQNAADRVEVDLANPNLSFLQKHIRGIGLRPFPTGVKVGPLTKDFGVEGLFNIDNSLRLELGFADQPLEEVFVGEVTGVEANFPNGGMPTMKLVAHDHLHRLTQGTKGRGFGPLPDFLVASILSAENLLIPLVDPAVQAASTALAAINFIFSGTGVKQGGPGEGESDFSLLQKIARNYDADFWVEGDVLYLSRFVKEYSPRLTLTWGESLVDFSPTVSTAGQAAGVAMKFTLREIPLDFLVTVFYDFDREAVGVSVVPGVGVSVGEAAVTIIDKTISSPADIIASSLIILHKLRAKLNKRLTGTGTSIGDPRIRAGAVIRLEGLGPDFSRDYRVTSASHSVDGNAYMTNFEVAAEVIP